MGENGKFVRNIIIMVGPVIVLTLPLLVMFGESFLLLAVPVGVGVVLSITLEKRLDTKDAIAYPFVQYGFLVLMFGLMWMYPRIGLGFILLGPFIFIMNTLLVYCYFKFAKKIRARGKICVLIASLLLTALLYSEQYGSNSGVPALFRMLQGDFGRLIA